MGWRTLIWLVVSLMSASMAEADDAAELGYLERVILPAAARDVLGVTISAPVSEAEGLLQAKLLVSMLETDSDPIGAALVVGINTDCLYLATAAHVLSHNDTVFARFQHEQRRRFPLKRTEFLDRSLDLAILCLPTPEITLQPLPPFSGVRLGIPQQLEPNDPLLSIGHSDAPWHISHASVIGHRDLNQILVDDNMQRNDSGGGVFSPEAGNVLEVVGIIVRGSTVLKVSSIASRMQQWGIPFMLTQWNFRFAAERQKVSTMIAHSNVSWPGYVETRNTILANLHVTIDAGRFRRGSALIVGHDKRNIYLAMPSYLTDTTQSIKAQFSDGTTAKLDLMGNQGTDSSVVIASVNVQPGTLSNLNLQHEPISPGHVYAFPRPLDSPYIDRTTHVGNMQIGTALYHYGYSPLSDKVGVLSPKSILLQSKAEHTFIVHTNAIPASKRGGLILNDRYEILGLVTGRNPNGGNSFTVANIESILQLARDRGAEVSLTTPSPQWQHIATQVNGFEAQPNGACWSRSILTGGQDRALDIAFSEDGKIIVAGRTNSFGADGDDGFVLRTNTKGDLLDFSTSGLSFNDELLSVAADDEPYAIAGQAFIERSNYVSLAEKLRIVGTILLSPDSQQLLGDETMHWKHNDIKVDENFAYAAGYFAEDNVVKGAGIRKYSRDHRTVIWQAFLEDTNPFKTLTLADHSIVAGGYYISKAPNRSQDLLVAAFDIENGQEKWRYQPHLNNANEEITGVSALQDGSIVAVGNVFPNNGRWYSFAMRLSPSGELMWRKNFAYSDAESLFHSVVAQPGGGIVAAGNLYRDWQQKNDKRHSFGWLTGIDTDGNIQWHKHYSPKYQNGARSGTLLSIDSDRDGNLVAAGYSTVLSLPQNTWVIKTSSMGELDCLN